MSESCYACGSNLDERGGSVDLHTMEMYCDEECAKSGHKYVAPICDDEFTVPVKGKCSDGSAISGVAEFDIHGTIHITLTHPALNATIEVPRAFADAVKELWD